MFLKYEMLYWYENNHIWYLVLRTLHFTAQKLSFLAEFNIWILN